MDNIAYSKSDSLDDIRRKLNTARNMLASEQGKRSKDRAPLTEAYLELSIKVFERDLGIV